MNISQTFLAALAQIIPTTEVHAHCDYPCGIYDPHLAQIGALTVIRMMDLIHEHNEHIQKHMGAGGDRDKGAVDIGTAVDKDHGHDELELRNNFIRAVNVKEEHAELVKREIRVIWGDYIKVEHLDKHPELTGLVHTIMQLGSKCRQTVNREQAIKLLDAVNKFAEIFWDSKGVKTFRAKAPYKPEEQIVYPDLKG